MINIMHDLYSKMGEEIDGAECYARKALSYKESMPTLANMFHQMSQEEMKHANMLEAEIKRAVGSEKEKNKDVYVTMETIYNFMHDQFVDKVIKVQMMQSKFKGA